MPVSLEIIDALKTLHPDIEEQIASLDERLLRMMKAVRLANWELSLLICDDAQIRTLNREHRGIDQSTDVLAFPLHEPFPPLNTPSECLLGDIVLSVETAARQATGRNVSLLEELTFLSAHGLLHLIGLDHRTRDEERRMTARTDLLCCAAKSREN